MAIQQELSPRVPSFSYLSVDAFREGMSAKDAYRYDNYDLYPRDGFPSLARLEKHLAQLVGVDDGHVLLTTTGMSAVVTAIEIVNLTKGDVIVHGFQSYSESREYIEKDLQPRGIKPVGVHISNLDTVASAINAHRPKVVFFETVSNGTEAEILDIEGFLKLPILKEVNPVIVLDNTLPTDSNLPLAHLIKQTDLRIVGVESGTKSYALNQDLAGIIYTYDRDLFKRLQGKRRRGDSPGLSLVRTLEGVIPPTKEQFDRENRTIAKNTAALALACWNAADSKKIKIEHHGLPDHPQSNLANALYPNGASPVFFILSQPQWQGSENDVSIEAIVRALETSLLANGLLPNKDFYFAQSFGFNKIGICVVPDSYIRIAGGLETPEQLEKMKRVLADGLVAVIEHQDRKSKELRFGPNNEFTILPRPGKQEDCAQESLCRLGYDGYALFPEGTLVSNFDIEDGIPGTAEVSNIVLQEGYDPKKTYLVIGEKKSNGQGHWYLRIGDTVINPERGEPEPAEHYEKEEIKFVILSYEIPPCPLLMGKV